MFVLIYVYKNKDRKVKQTMKKQYYEINEDLADQAKK